MKPSTKRLVYILLFGLIGLLVLWIAFSRSSSNFAGWENYEPISEFQAPYEALSVGLTEEPPVTKVEATLDSPQAAPGGETRQTEAVVKPADADPDEAKPLPPTENSVKEEEAKVEVQSSKPNVVVNSSQSSETKISAKPTASAVGYYDIEETVRIMHGLELAQSQSEDFYAFLEYMAQQDYRLVADDVLQSKTKLLAILQEMFVLEKEHEELDGIWVLAKSFGAGADAFLRETDPKGVITTVAATATGNLAAILCLGNSAGLKEAKAAVFEQYDEEMELKRSLSKKIDALKMAYIEYLTEFTPIYNKYMEEWDRLCLDKDKAYFDLYSGRMTDAYNSAEKILKNYPRNREALLLKSLSLINIGSGYMNQSTDANGVSISQEVNYIDTQEIIGEWNEYFVEADVTLDHYMEAYPGYSAPALALKGLLHLRLGESSRAMSYLDQAAMEYPRQAAQLTDLLDSYRVRTYLNQTAEGQYLLRLYRSTMEGYGMFSPNLLKAQYYAQIGDSQNSQTEIYNHFFRRGNQGIYDCLLSDMQYCENYLYGSFKELLMERHYLDIYIKANDGLLSSGDEIKVAIHNRSDIDLENVRAFLCIHYTDMYTDEYDVVKVPAVNIVSHYEKKDLGTVKLDHPGKTTKDITRIRAIIMTDDKICWVDEPKYKQSRGLNLSSNSASPSSSLTDLAKQDFVKEHHLETTSLEEAIKTSINVIAPASKNNASFVGKMTSNITDMISRPNKNLKIELPRILSFIDPTFSIHEIMDTEKAVLPVQNYLAGSIIRLEFDYKPKEEELIPLYIYSSFANFRIDIVLKDGKYEVLDVSSL